jgi:hypothetical protein
LQIVGQQGLINDFNPLGCRVPSQAAQFIGTGHYSSLGLLWPGNCSFTISKTPGADLLQKHSTMELEIHSSGTTGLRGRAGVSQ